MPRRRISAERLIQPDPKYGSVPVAQFANCIMHSGKRSIAIKIVYGAFDYIAHHFKERLVALESVPRTDETESVDGLEGREDGSSAHTSAKQTPVLQVFLKALEQIRPTVEVRARRVGGATYQIPCEVRPSRRTALAMRWLKEAAKVRSEKTMTLRLAAEIMEAFDEKGGAVKRRMDTHRMAKANQAFAHFRWTRT